MSSDSPAAAPAPRPAPPLLPAVLAATAVAAALTAALGTLPGLFGTVALLTSATACALAGAIWSHQRQAERLREARQERQLLGQLLDSWIWQTDREHRLLRLQPPQGAPGSAWVGHAVSGQRLWERFADGDGSLPQRMAAEAVLPELRVRQLSGNGPQHWLLRGLPRHDADGRFIGYIGTARPTDQADRQSAAGDGLDALLRNGPVALCLALREPGEDRWQLRRANEAARRLLELDADAERLPWEQALSGLPGDLQQRVLALQPGQQAEANGWQAWLSRIGPEGSAAEGLLLAVAPRDSDGATLALAAEHASFSYTISHDLRAPIRVVEGFTRILREDYGRALDRIGNDHLDRVLGAAARMNHMIDALLSLSQLSTQPLARQPVNLSQLAQFVVDDLRRTTPERQVTTRIEPGMTTQGDPTLLRMALENLIGNAWKYSAKCAQAEIAFEQVEQAGRKVFAVSDNGAGFDMRFADRLFGVFQRLHSSSDFQGTGVGLASVRRIVRRHGGEIWAESEVGHGARFFFTLRG